MDSPKRADASEDGPGRRSAGPSERDAEAILTIIQRLLHSPYRVPEDETAEDHLRTRDRALNSVRGQAAAV